MVVAGTVEAAMRARRWRMVRTAALREANAMPAAARRARVGAGGGGAAVMVVVMRGELVMVVVIVDRAETVEVATEVAMAVQRWRRRGWRCPSGF